jgi:hypothetical protein
MDIKIALSAKDWAKLPSIETMQKERWPVTLTDVETQAKWQAYVLSADSHRDSSTRLRTLVIAVDNPLQQTPALYAGSFVKASLKGISMGKLWQLPSTAFSQKSQVWYLNQENRLAAFSADPVFSANGQVYITPPTDLQADEQRVLIRPYNSYLEGMKVKSNLDASQPQENSRKLLAQKSASQENSANPSQALNVKGDN